MLANYQINEPHAPQTPKVVGRHEEINAIEQAIIGNDSRSIFYFVAEGGMGKTRLLEEVDRIEASFSCPPIIDLYHQQNHSPGGLRQAIVDGLGGLNFPKYSQERSEFIEKREIGLSGGELEKIRADLDNIFVREYNKLAANQRILLRFDTLELLQYEHDDVQYACLVNDVDTVIKNWLLTVIPQLQNTVTIFAGRPRPKTEGEFAEKFKKEGCVFKKQSLEAFTPDEVRQYLQLLQQESPDEFDPLLSPETQQMIDNLSEGKPIRLALIVDLLLHEEPFGGLSDKEDIDQQLVEHLMRLPEPYGLAISFSLQARKGLDKPLLHYLWPRQSNTETSVDEIMEGMLSFAFTKTYQSDTSRIFLHDELYDLYDRYFIGDPRHRQESFKTLRNYYIERLAEETSPEEIENIKLALLYYALHCDPGEAYYKYYSRWDEEAIKKHETSFDMRLRDEVLHFFNRYAFDYDSEFFDMRVADLVNEEKIHRDSAVRWVKRHLARGDFERAAQAAKNVRDLKDKDGIFHWDKIEDPLYKAGLLTAWSEALLYTGASEKDVLLLLLDEVFKLLPDGYSSGSDIEPDAEELDSEVWWRKQILGKAYNNRGYLYWANGRYGIAFDDFRHALGYFRQINLEDERANTLTNLAYVMALLGRVDTANYHIERALEIRERLDKTKRYTIALSRNTRGLLYSLGDHFDVGIKECREALNICEEVNEQRGIGMACNALGFSLRRRGEQWKKGELIHTIENAETDFTEAEENLLRALDIFSEQVPEPIRLWEVHNELGSLYLDWAYLTHSQQKDFSRAAAQYDDSIKHQEKALKIAEEKNLSFQITDSHDDLAQAFQDYGGLLLQMGELEKAASYRAKAERYLTRIETDLIPKEYQLKEMGADFSTPLLSESGVAYWQSLGKVYLQRGVWEAHKLERREVTFGERPEVARRCIRYLAISFVYFQQYGPQSMHLENTKWAFTRRLGSLRVTPEMAHEEIVKLEEEFGLNLRILKNTIDDTLGL